jgi:hypothetical protein
MPGDRDVQTEAKVNTARPFDPARPKRGNRGRRDR